MIPPNAESGWILPILSIFSVGGWVVAGAHAVMTSRIIATTNADVTMVFLFIGPVYPQLYVLLASVSNAGYSITILKLQKLCGYRNQAGLYIGLALNLWLVWSSLISDWPSIALSHRMARCRT